MIPPRQERPLKLVETFIRSTDNARRLKDENPYGYQKVDELRVLERQFVPICIDRWDGRANTHMLTVTVYDFNSFQTIVTLQHMKGSDVLETKSSTIPFSAVEGKQSIRDAHRALTELGGTPPPLDDILEKAASPVILKNGLPGAPKIF